MDGLIYSEDTHILGEVQRNNAGFGLCYEAGRMDRCVLV